MAQEFVIKSEQIEDKINQLLPSQGGFQAGVDFSASTMVVPIVDLTETAEGSSLRQDLQTSFSHVQVTHNSVTNATTTIVNTTGYYRVFGNCIIYTNPANPTGIGEIQISDGTTNKVIQLWKGFNTDYAEFINNPFDFIVKLEAGDSLIAVSNTTNVNMEVTTRQLADVNGNLTNP